MELECLVNLVTLEDVAMTTENTPTKAEFLEALKKNGINTLEDFIDAIFPETGGFSWMIDYADGRSIGEISGKGKFNVHFVHGPDVVEVPGQEIR